MSPDPLSLIVENKRTLDQEFSRVADICNGCRRCFNLCPSFEQMFIRIDGRTGEADSLKKKDQEEITDLCYYCKLCYNHCPYTPPHSFNLDFPRLMLLGKAEQAKRRRPALRDRLLVDTDRVGRWARRLAPLLNRANAFRPIRRLLHHLVGIHQERILPTIARETFTGWLRQRKAPAVSSPGAARKVALFHTCYVNYNDPDIGKAAVQVLEKNNIEVVSPDQLCCGMPYFDIGDIESAKKKARLNIRFLQKSIDAGCDIVAPMPTCSLMLKKEYPALLGDEAISVSKQTFDLCEYLMRLNAEGKLSKDFKNPVGKVSYQIPCHLRDQNIGYKSRDLMKLIPGTTIDVIEKCSAHDGTWGIKKEYFDDSMRTAKPLFKAIEEGRPDVVATDCPLAGMQILQGTGKKPLHPIQILKKAYGL
ncbi:MAG TPA: anaerobic glycerol-3-phosphate dehydrogenase subunit C [Candidatus Manganitrophaceae bacterium]|nr:anaerobic glycerol-3-phosphate dehydrogenase subunit C [Candidatus Manganitrophaceae bacterium]